MNSKDTEIRVLDNESMIVAHNMWLKVLGFGKDLVSHVPASIEFIVAQYTAKVRAAVLEEVRQALLMEDGRFSWECSEQAINVINRLEGVKDEPT